MLWHGAFATLALTLLVAASPAQADSTALCAAAAKPVHAELFLNEAVVAAFGNAAFSGAGDECIYPLKAFRYASADVLLLQAGEPGEGCHGCGAKLSAYVIQRTGGGLKAGKRFRQFAELGSNGAIIDAWPIEVAGDDAIAIEAGGTFQGHTATALDVFAFRGGALVRLTPDLGITLDADNEGAADDAGQAIHVAASWFFDPADKTALVVDYKIDAKGAKRVERVVWRLQGGKLVLTKGRLPQEVTDASGG
jgi:hypothetical protein